MPKRMSQEEFEKRVKEYTQDTVIVISEYINKKTKVKIKCKTCGYEWDISPATLMPSNMKDNHFIGCPECKYTTTLCSYCSKEIKRLKSDLANSKSGFVYCSRECGNRHKNDLKKSLDSTAYRRNAFEKYEHKCAICGYYDMIENLEVHHIDENHNNNDISNLIILCPICHKKLTMHLFTLNELINFERNNNNV